VSAKNDMSGVGGKALSSSANPDRRNFFSVEEGDWKIYAKNNNRVPREPFKA
jgi:hypothetical protein